MSEQSAIVKHKLSEVLNHCANGEDQTRPDAPDAASLGDVFWAQAKVVAARGKTSIHLRVDRDVLDWF